MMVSRQTELPAAIQQALEDWLTSFPSQGEPLPVVFATGDFAPLLTNWLWHAKAAGVKRSLIVAMDDTLTDSLALSGTPAVRHGFDGSLSDLWFQRTLVFEWLAAHGVDFIHSDIDAVWLRDPRPFCFADGAFDLVFSQGTNYPAEAWRQWGFVLCCGLFAARANPATTAFFAAVRALAARIGDDQVAVNILLLYYGLSWPEAGSDSYQNDIRGLPFTCYRTMLEGFSVQPPLRVGLLPHHLVPRLPIIESGALARHPLGPGNPTAKADILRAVGCWMPRDA